MKRGLFGRFTGFKRLANGIQRRIRGFKRNVSSRLDNVKVSVGQLALEKMQSNVPEWQPDLYPTRLGDRPSERIGNIPLAEGLRASSLTTEDTIFTGGRYGMRIVVNSSSGHARYFTKGVPEKWLGGTRPHRMPSTGIMKDRGHPMTFHFASRGENWKVWNAVGPVRRQYHITPGDFGDFVRDGWEEAKPEIINAIKAGLAS